MSSEEKVFLQDANLSYTFELMWLLQNGESTTENN